MAKRNPLDQRHGSADKGACLQGWWPEFDSWTYMMEGQNWILQIVPWSPDMTVIYGTHRHRHRCKYTINKYIKKLMNKVYLFILKELCSIIKGNRKRNLVLLVAVISHFSLSPAPADSHLPLPSVPVEFASSGHFIEMSQIVCGACDWLLALICFIPFIKTYSCIIKNQYFIFLSFQITYEALNLSIHQLGI